MFVTFFVCHFQHLVIYVACHIAKKIKIRHHFILFSVDIDKDSLLFRISEPWQVVERFAGVDRFPLARLLHLILPGFPFVQHPGLDSEDNVASRPDQPHPVLDDPRVEVGGDAHTGDQVEGGRRHSQGFVQVGLGHDFVHFLTEENFQLISLGESPNSVPS